MYGTVARFRLKPGMEQKMLEWARGEEMRKIPGLIQDVVYRTDADANEYYLAVIFDSKESYVRNAESPEQDASYRKWRDMLEADPEWHDGEIIYGHHG
jgi:antibiotic biosynthesis monooxygenase (ABM) superfamily enzyme